MRDDLMPGTIVVRPQPAARDSHADTGSYPLPEWPCGRLNTRRQRVVRSVFGMSRAFAMQLTEVHDIVERKIEAIHMQVTIEQYGGMAARQNKTVTIKPARIAWVKMQKPVPEGRQNVGD